MDELQAMRDKVRKAEIARAKQMIEMRKRGLTLEAIGEHFGITKQRVQQIIAAELDRQNREE